MRLRAWLVLLVPAVAVASTIIPHSLRDRAAKSDRVAVARVLEQHVVDEGTVDRPKLKTHTRLAVSQDVRGTGPREVTVVQLGGKQGPWDSRIPGDASFVVGETALVFLSCPVADRCYLVALGEGRLSIVGEDLVYRDLLAERWVKRPLKQVVQELAPPAVVPTTPRRSTGVAP